MKYTATVDTVSFSQAKLPALFFVVLGQLGIYITLTGSKIYPYKVSISESEFLSCVEIAKEM